MAVKRSAAARAADRTAELLAFCKLTELADDPEVQLLLPAFQTAAEEYLAAAGISKPEDGTARRAVYDLLVDRMVLDAWDRRESAAEGQPPADNPAFRRMLNQLKQTEPESGLF